MDKDNRIQIAIITVLALIIVSFVLYVAKENFQSIKPAGINNNTATTEVKQDAKNLPAPFSFKETTIIPLRNFCITGKILSRKRYRSGKEAKISPIDFAMGWGAMADEKVLRSIRISQSNRWYYWRTKQFPIPRREIETHSANMHIIPADDIMSKKVLKAKKGEIVKISGYLVRVIGNNNWTWQSSLTRNDTGNHACEVIFVKDFEILD